METKKTIRRVFAFSLFMVGLTSCAVSPTVESGQSTVVLVKSEVLTPTPVPTLVPPTDTPTVTPVPDSAPTTSNVEPSPTPTDTPEPPPPSNSGDMVSAIINGQPTMVPKSKPDRPLNICQQSIMTVAGRSVVVIISAEALNHKETLFEPEDLTGITIHWKSHQQLIGHAPPGHLIREGVGNYKVSIQTPAGIEYHNGHDYDLYVASLNNLDETDYQEIINGCLGNHIAYDW